MILANVSGSVLFSFYIKLHKADIIAIYNLFNQK